MPDCQQKIFFNVVDGVKASKPASSILVPTMFRYSSFLNCPIKEMDALVIAVFLRFILVILVQDFNGSNPASVIFVSACIYFSERPLSCSGCLPVTAISIQ